MSLTKYSKNLKVKKTLLSLLFCSIILTGCVSANTGITQCAKWPEPPNMKMQSEVPSYIEKGRLAHLDCSLKLKAVTAK